MIASVGIDIGSGKTVIVQDDADLVLTETGGISRPSLVSFFGRVRLVDEHAAAQQNDSTVSINFDLIGVSLEKAQRSELFAHRKCSRLSENSGGRLQVSVQYNDEMIDMDVASLLGMFLAKQESRIGAVVGGARPTNLCFVCPPDSSADAKRTLHEGAAIAGIDLSRVHLVDKVDCMLCTYGRKFQGLRPGEKTNLAGKRILMVEMGQCHSTCVLLAMPATPDEHGNSVPEKLAYSHDNALGALYFDMELFQHFAALCVSKYKSDPVAPGSKRGVRLLAGCERLRKLLSQLPEGSVTVENMTDSGDITLPLKREEMSTFCGSLLARFKELIVGALRKASLDAGDVYAVEVLGGGSRMQVVQQVISEVFGAEMPLGAKFDDSSIALGAAIFTNKRGETASAEEDAGAAEAAGAGHAMRGLTEEQTAALRARELDMQQQDDNIVKVLAVRNSLEAYLLDMRGAPRRKFGNSIDAGKLNALIDNTESWLWDNSDASLADLEAKNSSLRGAVCELCATFFTAVEQERLEVERQLDADAAAAAAERAEGGEDDQDHDNRRLKYADRLRLVQKNKDEGTELFQGAVSEQQFRTSAARYSKALSHCMKFFDLSPEQEKETRALKVVLYLNIASCYLKLNNPESCINNCNHAIEIDPKNPKAYFRRSMGYEAKKDFDKALEDVKTAQTSLDVEDKALTAAAKRIRALIAEEKKKEKGVWGKLFG